MTANVNKKSGFTLVEMAIVLVVVGLIIGGVLQGQELIRNSQLNKVISEAGEFKSAVNTFMLKYNCLRGDCNRATAYWGQVSGNCTTQQGTGTQTCNGNGDKIIGEVTSSQIYEVFRFWQHLSNAGIIKGVYSGVAGPVRSRDAVIGTNVPKSILGEIGFSLVTYSSSTFNSYISNYPQNFIGTFFQIGSDNNPSVPGYEALGWAFTAPEVNYIDSKIDNGMPLQGYISVYRYGSSQANQCASSDVWDTATYATDDVNRCFINYKVLDF